MPILIISLIALNTKLAKIQFLKLLKAPKMFLTLERGIGIWVERVNKTGCWVKQTREGWKVLISRVLTRHEGIFRDVGVLGKKR